MSDEPATLLISATIAAYLLYLWIVDYRLFQRGTPNLRALPGSTPAPAWLIGVAALGSVLIVGAETALEYTLGISGEQSDIQPLFLVAMVSAGIVEEVLFRGFLVVTKKGRAALIGSIVGFSALFALVHMHWLTNGDDGSRALDLGAGPVLWTVILFVNSLWWYAVRFMPANRHRSLLPCFAGHIASNLAVFAIKLAQGHVV